MPDLTTLAGIFDILIGGIMGYIALRHARSNFVAAGLICALAGLIIAIGARFLTK